MDPMGNDYVSLFIRSSQRSTCFALPTFAMTPATCRATKAALRRFSNSKDENGEPWSDVAMSSSSSTQFVENGVSVYIYILIYMQNN